MEHLLDLDVAHDLLSTIFAHGPRKIVQIGVVVGDVRDEVAPLVQLAVVELSQVKRDVLEVLASHAILTIQELDDDFTAGTHSAIILDHHVLEGLHQTTRDVTGICSLHSRIDQSFATAHCVEVEF